MARGGLIPNSFEDDQLLGTKVPKVGRIVAPEFLFKKKKKKKKTLKVNIGAK